MYSYVWPCIYISIYRLDPDKYFIGKLTVDHVDYITDHWTDKDKPIPIIRRYLQNIFTMYDFAVGVFLRSHPSYPVSWAIYSDYGYVVFLHTIPEYRKKGFSGIILSALYSSLLDHRHHHLIPFGERTKGSFLSKRFSHVENYYSDYTWRDSITGECYW